MLTVTVAGQVVQRRRGSLSIGRSIDERAVCTVVVVDRDRTMRFRQGDPFEITAPDGAGVGVPVTDDAIPVTDGGVPVTDGIVAFRGFVAKPTERAVGVGDDRALYHHLTATDNHYLADKRIIAKAWIDTPSGDVVKDIVDTWLAAEGVTYTAESIDAGSTLVRWAATYLPASRVIDEIADANNFWWVIDDDRVLHFLPRTKNLAPWTVTGHDTLKGSVELENANAEYRNVQWVVGASDRTDLQTETFVGDGTRQTFNVAFPVAAMPTVKVNTVEQTVGVRGIDDDSGSDWFFSFRSNEISQNSSGTPLASSDDLEVAYVGFFDTVTRSDFTDQITARETREGTSGIVDAVLLDETIESRTEAFNRAAAKLEKYARDGKTLRFETVRAGLMPGQLATVNLPHHGLIGAEMLITRVSSSVVAPGQMAHEVEAVEGPVAGSWVKLFRALSERGLRGALANISEDEILTRLFPFSKTWTELEHPNIFREFLSDGTVTAGDGRFPMFAHDDRLTHVELYDPTSGLVLRKQLTTRSGLDTTEITTSLYVGPQEANSDVGDVAWFGGIFAGAVAGSGVEVARETLTETKVASEAWQIDRTDTRWT